MQTMDVWIPISFQAHTLFIAFDTFLVELETNQYNVIIRQEFRLNQTSVSTPLR